MSKVLLSGLICMFFFYSCSTLRKSTRNNSVSLSKASPGRNDSARKDSGTGLKPYNTIITTKAVTQMGLFKIHRLDNKHFFEIPDSLFDRDILVVSRISKAPAMIRGGNKFFGYQGDQIGENIIRFTKEPNNKVFLRRISYWERAYDSSANGLHAVVQSSNFHPVLASFEIKTITADSGAVVLDLTDYMNSDNSILFFGSQEKKALSLTTFQADKSYIASVSAYPMNIEIKTVKTYSVTGGFESTPDFTFVEPDIRSFELNSSIVLLPKYPMQPRKFDQRVGYFATGYIDFDANPQGVENTYMITRWKLEPKDSDIQKYLAGELVEPKKPIVFYIDPKTPRKWAPYLIQGVNDWQRAFEKAGFKNAIYAREAPGKEEDSTWSIEDARHNVIVYKASAVPNASGPHIHDPRSGEIIEAHVNWYHNVMELLHNWYMIQAGPIDERARKMEFEDSLMGQLIRFVCSHEIGHTLGLQHNFGASSTVPVDSLRNKHWVEANGHTPSIMDYARFNYVAQPEDSVSESGIFPRIGAYDEWAIEWGYKYLPNFNQKKQMDDYLHQLIIGRTSKDKRLWFGGDNLSFNDPRAQAEDLGNNAVKAGEYGIKNLKRTSEHLIEWTKVPGKDFSSLALKYSWVLWQYNLYMERVAAYIGGIEYNVKTADQPGDIVSFTKRSPQKEAIQFIDKYLFSNPEWLIKLDIQQSTLTAAFQRISFIRGVQKNILNRITSQWTLRKLLLGSTQDNIGDAYSMTELLYDLDLAIWRELKSSKPIDFYRRNLQKMYVDRLIELLTGKGEQLDVILFDGNKENDTLSILKGYTKNLSKEIGKAIRQYNDPITKWHLMDIRDRLKNTLEDFEVSKDAQKGPSKNALQNPNLNQQRHSSDNRGCTMWNLSVPSFMDKPMGLFHF